MTDVFYPSDHLWLVLDPMRELWIVNPAIVVPVRNQNCFLGQHLVALAHCILRLHDQRHAVAASLRTLCGSDEALYCAQDDFYCRQSKMEESFHEELDLHLG